MLVVEDAQFMDEASTTCSAGSRGGRRLRQMLLVTHSEPARTWAPIRPDETAAALSFDVAAASEPTAPRS